MVVNYNGSEEKAQETVEEIRKSGEMRFLIDVMLQILQPVEK